MSDFWENVAVAVGSVAVVVLGAAGFILNAEQEERKREERRAKRMDEDKAAALKCRCCGDMAFPVRNSKNGYKCESCGHGFNSVYHNLRWYG